MATEHPIWARFAEEQISVALTDTPVVVVNGPRQCGKSTLVKEILSGRTDGTYVTLDDQPQIDAAKNDPVSFVDRSGLLVVDEVQRVPELMLAIKSSVDRDRRPGRFLLTGSTQLLSTPRVADSLAGRVELIDLWPLSQREIGARTENFLDLAFEWRLESTGLDLSRLDYFEALCAGGFPEALVRTGNRRSAWFENYSSTVVRRLVGEVADIDRMDLMPALMRLCAASTASEANVSALADRLNIPRRTLSNYMNHLETVFMLKLLPAWSKNLSAKVIRKPKLHLVDSGLAAHLLGVNSSSLMRPDSEARGPLFESFVTMEVCKQLSWSNIGARMYHFRDRDGAEVDLALESRGGKVLGIEIKSASTVGWNDFKGLRMLQSKLGSNFVGGIVIYTGSQSIPFGERLAAFPASVLWSSVGRSSNVDTPSS